MSVETRPRLGVVLCWHMHQPEYRDLETGAWHQPWTYLHAIKDYIDMASHLETADGAAAVVNFAPVLLEQIDSLAHETRAALGEGATPREPLLAALLEIPADDTRRLALLRACTRAHEHRVIDRFPAYRTLVDLGRRVLEDHASIGWLGEGYFRDLVIWYHLAWIGETVRRADMRVKALELHATDFAPEHARRVLELVTQLLEGLLPRYRALAEIGRVELSFTPWGHPIVPLLLDFECARDAMPGVTLPKRRYPDGAERARWHLREGMASFERHFGEPPRGCWLSEGGISDAALGLLDECGLAWTASGESVLGNSVASTGAGAGAGGTTRPAPAVHRPFRVDGHEVRCFFRSDRLSDLIGFNYADWHADDAVANLIHELTQLADARPAEGQQVVSIIMDGENAWEHYPDNGYWFLSALYRQLADHPRIELLTFSKALDHDSQQASALPSLVAGSWVYGTFSTWIGDPEKNLAWDLLVAARETYLRIRQEARITPEAIAEAGRRLAVCEASDWFWWFGDYNPAESVRDFDRLYRGHLASLYAALGVPPPATLAVPLSRGSSTASMEHGGVMRRGGSE